MRTRAYDFREVQPSLAPDERAPSRHPGLRALLLALAISGGFLYLLGGPPHLPVRPDPRAIIEALRSANPALQGAASWCFALAWALWLWTASSLLVQGLLLALERLTGGAAWILALRPALAPLLMPLARRALPVLTAGIIVARLAASPTPSAAAAPAPLVLALTVADQSPGGYVEGRAEGAPGPTEHTVIEGDTLWALAERHYGDGALFPVLHEANLDRLMPDGTRYEGRLRPGQLLLVPPTTPAAVSAAETFVYTVEGGDTLRAITARFLGDEMRWPEIFALNQGIACLPDGRTLADPDLIWPGLALTIPASPSAPAPAPIAVSPAQPAAPPAPTPPSPAPTPPPPPLPIGGTPAANTPSAAPTTIATPTPTLSATPTPATPVSVGPVATIVPPTSVTTVVVPPQPAPSSSSARFSPGRAPLVVGTGALGAAIVGGAAFLLRRQLLARRELRHRLRAAASPAVAIREVPSDEPRDFADGDLLGTFTHRAHGGEVEPAVALAHHAARFFAEEGLDEATPLLAAQGARGDAALLVGAPRAAREQLAALAPALGSLLGGGGRAVPVRATGDVELRLTGLTAAGLLAPLVGPEDVPLPTMFPLAELPGATPLFANWEALGHLLVVGGLGEGADIALTGLAATLASRRHPDTLRLWAIAHPQALPPELFRLPHWGDPLVDPDDRARVAGLLADLRAELDRRREEPPDTPRPELVLILAEATDVLCRDGDGPEMTTLEILATDGPLHGIRFLAATARPEALDEGALRLFASRLVLRLADEAQSVRLLGVPDATTLPGGGRLLLRLAGRTPRSFAGVPTSSARGYRIAPEALAALAEQLGRTYKGENSPVIAPRSRGDVAPIDTDTARAASPTSDDNPPDGTAVSAYDDFEEGLPGIGPTDERPSCTGRRPRPDAPSPADQKDAAPVHGLMVGQIMPGSNGETHDDNASGAGSAPALEIDPDPAPVSDLTSPADGRIDRAAEGVVGIEDELSNGAAALASSRPGAELVGDSAPASQSSTEVESAVVDIPTPGTAHPPTHPSALTPEEITADLLALESSEEPPVATPLDIRCFGPFRALHAGEVLAPRHHAKAWELLQLLAAHPPRSLTKDRLWISLWPDQDSWPTRNVLNTMIGRLRQELTGQVPDLPREVVQRLRGGECWLDPDLVTVDVHRWLAIIKREPKLSLTEALGEYRLARALYHPTLLEGASYEWLALRDDGVTLVEDYAERWSDYRLRLARRCAREGRPSLAVPLYRAMLGEQPKEEAFARELFRCYGQVGDLAGLERQMRALETALHEGYGDEGDPSRSPVVEQPEKETAEVFAEVRAMLARGDASGTDGSGG